MSKNGGNLTIQYNLRWTEEMRDKIAEAAKENTRSMNQEIIARLEQSFEQGLNHETEMYMMAQVVKDQQKQIDQLHEMVKQLVFRPRQMDD
ncbi:Arc family DNA-binding protein [Acinetobacter sp. NIPH1876]|uniref:Arc family DNA-binding protein n=1 Tax=Acinetobacter sp. NIPH1876 TaxID=2924041 RepID=UPI001FAB773E|nr:Arc family DNA-binding protein [Acinetobacter sp. NIPH1876]MCJ0828702.1 Arc family DNA-binding protein [Acinetobacter sp. NIPH1876]